MEPIGKVARTDASGRIAIEHDFGLEHANRDVRFTLEVEPNPSRFRGSQKHVLDLIDRPDFAERIERIIGIPEIVVGAEPLPIPSGHAAHRECDIDDYIWHKCPDAWPQALGKLDRGRWWAPYGGTRPQMDLICRILVSGSPGLLFVEAKAHEGEIDWGGKELVDNASEGSRLNHDQIAAQITEASKGLNRSIMSGFTLSVTKTYQLANRLTYLWKLAQSGVPAVLLYLGFVGDDYFQSDYFRDDAHWQRVMGGHLQGVVPQGFPNRLVCLTNDGPLFGMLIRSSHILELSRK